MRFSLLSLLLVSLSAAYAQSSASSQVSTSQTSTSSPSPSISLSLTTGLTTATVATRVGTQTSQVVSIFPIVFNVTSTLIPSSTSTSSNTSPTPTSSVIPSAVPFVLATKVDPAFGVLGAILILTGLPSAFWGHKNRWTSFFLIGFYSLSLVCIVLILKFGVIPAINPPSKTLRGMFVLASAVAGIAGGAVAIFFWKAARYGIGAWGGFAVALWIQCFQNGGVVKPIGFRWILYIGCGVIGFVLCAIPRIHYHILLVSTAFVGSSAFILGVDCFTTAGLKEFYIWNLGFPGLFPKYVNNHIQFPVSQTMEIELGLIGAISLMGIAVQLRILKVLERKLQEIGEEAKRQDQDAELQASTRFKEIEAERFAWEKDHPTLRKHGRQESALSSMPLMTKDGDDSTSPTIPDPSSYTLAEEGRRRLSGVSDFKVAPISDEEPIRVSRFMQNPGALPTLDLGLGIQEDVPSSFIADEDRQRKDLTNAEWEDLKHKKELLAEIQTIRRSIDVLKSESPIPSSSEPSRRPSLSSKRTLSVDASSALLPLVSHSRPPRELDPRARVHSMEMSTLSRSPALSDPISRPTSTPLRNDWDTYIEERRLLQPPAGVTPPITTTSLHPTKIPIPPAVQDAMAKRKQRESALEFAEHGNDSSDDIPLSLAKVPLQKRQSASGYVPVTILPPRRHAAAPIAAPIPQRPPAGRTRTFEELNERHREKMRDMQAPLTQAEREHAELETAKQRWERSKALEKEAVTRRQAEKASAIEKRKRSGEGAADGAKQRSNPRDSRHSRSLSADKLAALGTSSRRLSTLKVKDWQRYQQEGETNAEAASGGLDGKRDPRSEGVPFPDTGKGSASYPRHTTRDRLT